MSIKQQIGKRLREIRLKRRLSQEKLSEMVNIGQNTLSSIESGNNFFTADTLEKLLTALEIQPEELFTFQHQRSSEELLEDINRLLKSNPDKIQEVYKIISAILH